jgi:hypothetical protein
MVGMPLVLTGCYNGTPATTATAIMSFLLPQDYDIYSIGVYTRTVTGTPTHAVNVATTRVSTASGATRTGASIAANGVVSLGSGTGLVIYRVKDPGPTGTAVPASLEPPIPSSVARYVRVHATDAANAAATSCLRGRFISVALGTSDPVVDACVTITLLPVGHINTLAAND